MSYNRSFDNEIRLALGLEPLELLGRMHGGRQKSEFFTETKQFIYGMAGMDKYDLFGQSLDAAIYTHPITKKPLFETAYLCRYCALTNSLNIYHHRMNCNLDHQDPFAGLLRENPAPTVTLSFRDPPGSLKLKQKREKALQVKLKETEYENVFEFDWSLLTHRQILYNDLNNLEITCHGHNRIKGDHLDREGTIGAALLIRLNRSNTDVEED